MKAKAISKDDVLHDVLESEERRLNPCYYVTEGDAAVSNAQVPQSSKAHVNARFFGNAEVTFFSFASIDNM